LAFQKKHKKTGVIINFKQKGKFAKFDKKFFEDNLVSPEEGLKNGFRKKVKFPEGATEEEKKEMRSGILGQYFEYED
jgi:hypothetical protein